MNRRSPTPPVEPESSLQAAIDAAQLGIFRWDRASGSIALRNDAAARLLGWERPQLTRAELLEQRVDRGHRDAASTAFDAAAAGSALSLRCRVRVWAEQPPRWLEFTAPAARAGDGGAAIGLIRDVSDEERERDLHRRYVDRLEASLAASRTGVWEFDLTTRDAYANDVMFEIAGASPHTPGPLGQVYWNQVYPDDMELHRSTIARAVEQRSHYRMEYRIRRLNDGAVRWVSSQGAVRCDDNGVPKWLVGTIVDITEQRATEQALLEEHERLQIALSTDPVGVFEIDIESGRRRWDPAMYRLYGVDPNVEPPVGNDFLALLVPEDRELFAARLAAVSESNPQFDVEFHIRRPNDHEIRRLHAKAKLIRDRHSARLKMIGLNFDVTERHRIESVLRESARLKDEFLATLAHELRNPLAPLANALHLLRRDAASAHASELVDVAERQTAQLTRLVDDLLEVARITQGKIALRREPIAASRVIGHAIESMRPFIDARRVALALDIDDPSVAVDVDAARLTQVLSNLLHNAGKYTPAGGHIRVAQRRIGDEIEISVADDGVGISPEFLPYVFELFAQGEQQLDRSEGGLGIGLPLVKRLVEMHGGRVAAESTGRGRGATFRIVLPCAQSAPAQAAADGATDAAGATPRDAAPRRILIVDDNQDAADTLAILLQSEGHEVRTWYSGDGALAQAREFKPHVALLDIGLPGVDGHTLAQALRADSAMHKTLLIALSGYGQREDKERSRAAGFAEHLVKPIDPKVLLARIGAASESG